MFLVSLFVSSFTAGIVKDISKIMMEEYFVAWAKQILIRDSKIPNRAQKNNSLPSTQNKWCSLSAAQHSIAVVQIECLANEIY